MARNQSLNHRNSDFRPQTSDLIFALQLQYYSFQDVTGTGQRHHD